MAIVQSSYIENMAIALPGMPADADYTAASKICETAAGIGFGVAVQRGTSDNEALIGAVAATDFVGVTIRDVNRAEDEYAQYDNMGVMQRGRIWVTVGGDVVAGDNVTFSATTGVLSSAAASGSQFAITGAVWETTASNGGLAKLNLTGSLPSA
jgi:hypothetical protein